MEQSHVFSLVIILIFLFYPFASSSTIMRTTPAASSNIGFCVELTHADATGNFSRAELLRRAVQRSKMRTAKLRVRGLGPVPVHPSQGEYLLDLAIGTPALYFTGILDSGSDLVWTQCKTCGQCIPQPSPLFDPVTSSSFSSLPCTHKLCRALDQFVCAPNCFYHYSYGDGTDTRGFLGTETFTFGSTRKVRIPHLTFGCGLFNGGNIQNSSGVIGFGRGPLSLVSQLGVGRFSYCFTATALTDNVPFTKSPLYFGSLANMAGANVRTTPLLRSPPGDPSFYYISLKGITVGRTLVPIPPETFQLKKDGSGGMIIDSGTTILQLVPEAYKPVLKAFQSLVKLPAVNGTDLGSFELCFKTPTPQVAMPKLIFHFHGGADWDMPQKNYMYYDDDAHLLCLMVQESEGISIFGNVLTQNMHVLYDLKNEKLSFMPAKCNQL